MKPTRMLRADLSPIFDREELVEGWEGSVMFETDPATDPDTLEPIADTIAQPWAEVSEWSCEIIMTGLYKLTPREWTTIKLERNVECRVCKSGAPGKCSC